MKERSKVTSLKLFVAFLVIMLVMTFVSRMMYTAKMPIVTTTTIKTQALSHDVQVNGTLEAFKKTPIFVPAELRIAQICVSKGDMVEAGDALIRLDKEYLKEKISDLESEILTDRLTMTDTYPSGSQIPVFTEPQLRVRDVCVKPGDTVKEGQELFYLDTDHLGRFLCDLQNEINSNICQRSACYSADDNHGARALSNTIEQLQRKYNAYYAIAQAQGVIYSNSDGVVASIIRAGELTSDTAVALISDEATPNYALAVKQQRLDDLKALAEQDSIIKSPLSGVVTDISADAASPTGEAAALTISDISEGFVFCAQLTEENTKYLSVGDPVCIDFRNGKKALNDCIVKLITKDENGSSYSAVIPLEDTELCIGEIGVLKATAFSANNSCVVPISAVTLDNNKNGHIYLLEETEGFLGAEQVVRKVAVKVEDSNDSFYGLAEAGLDPNAKIVISSSKKLSDGQRVRA